VSTPGVLDRGTAKRSWQAVLIEIKKKRPARAQLFATVEVDVDPDGPTLVIEFPEDQAFSLQIAEEPEMRDLLRASLARVLGAAPPFRFQLGRGAVRPAPAVEDMSVGRPSTAPAAPTATRSTVSEPPLSDPEEPTPEYRGDDAALDAPVESPFTTDAQPDWISQLGARVVAEHPHEPEGEDDQ